MVRRPVRLFAAVTLSGLLAAACSSSSTSSSTSSGSTAVTGTPAMTLAPLAKATLNGSGSTLQNNFDAAAIEAFTKLQPAVTINYNPTGSGAGQTDLEGQLTDFAGSDVPVAAADMGKFKGGTILYFPTVASPVTVSYNLTGVNTLQLSAPTLAQIFSRTVKTWNDPAVAADNPGVTLPNKPITVVHRSDGSGTTANFTEFLKVAGGSSWSLGSGKTVNWSTDTQAGKGNAGVLGIVKSTDGAVGYVDYSDAKDAALSFAMIKNATGKFVAPTLDAASAAVAGATVGANLLYDPINAAGAAAYPITAPTFVIAYAKQADAAKAAALKGFLTFLVGSDGQALAKTVNFAPVSQSLATQALAQIDKITVG